MAKYIFIYFAFLITFQSKASIFGEENIALGKLVFGQVEELRRLAEQVDIESSELNTLIEVNRGILNTIEQIGDLEAHLERLKSYDPRAVRQISDLTRAVEDLKSIQRRTFEFAQAKSQITRQAIDQQSIQSEANTILAKDMATQGVLLSEEAASASPGRAIQISAVSDSNRLITEAAQLQALNQIAEMEAITLELQRDEMMDSAESKRSQDEWFTQKIKANQRASSK